MAGCWAVCCRWTCATRARGSDALWSGAPPVAQRRALRQLGPRMFPKRLFSQSPKCTIARPTQHPAHSSLVTDRSQCRHTTHARRPVTAARRTALPARLRAASEQGSGHPRVRNLVSMGGPHTALLVAFQSPLAATLHPVCSEISEDPGGQHGCRFISVRLDVRRLRVCG